MNQRVLAERGSFPDVIFSGGWFYVGEQEKRDAGNALVIKRWKPGKLETFQEFSVTPLLASNQQAYPKLDRFQSDLALRVAYALGDEGRLKNITDGTAVSLGQVRGTSPFAFGGGGYLEYRRTNHLTIVRNVLTGKEAPAPANWQKHASTGLSKVLPTRQPVYMDETFHAVPWGTYAVTVGDLTVAEGKDNNGVIARFASKPGSQLRLWPTQAAFKPRVATNGKGTYAVVVGAQGKHPARLAEIAKADATDKATP